METSGQEHSPDALAVEKAPIPNEYEVVWVPDAVRTLEKEKFICPC